MRTICCVALLAGLLLAGCKKPKASLEFTEAKGLHSTLVARDGDDAYESEDMARVEALLDKVPADSLDAAAAAELKGNIAAERQRIAAEAAAHAKLLDSVNEVPDVPSSSAARVEPPQPTEAPAVADAGGAQGDPVPGMTVDELRRATGDCFTSSGTLKLKTGDQAQGDGEMYERVDSGNCRFRYPTYQGRILVFQAGKMLGAYDKSALQAQTALKPGGVVTTGAGGAGGTAGGPAGAPAPAPVPGQPAPNITPAPPQNELPQPPTSPGEQTGQAPQ